MKIAITFSSIFFFYLPSLFYLKNFEEYGQHHIYNLIAFYSLGLLFIFIIQFFHKLLGMKRLFNVLIAITIWVALYPLVSKYNYGKFDDWIFSNFENLILSTKLEQKIELLAFLILLIVIFLIKERLKNKVIHILLIFIHITYFSSLVTEINNVYLEMKESNTQIIKKTEEFKDIYTLSPSRNVLVFMPDMMSGVYFQKVLEKQPDLIASLDGFTLFPNAIAVGNTTHTSVHAIQGGELGTPLQIMKNKPRDMTLVEYWQNHAPSFLDDFEKNNWKVVKVSHTPNHQGDSGKRQTYQFPLDHLLGQTDHVSKSRFSQAELVKVTSFILFQISPLFIKPNIYRNGLWLLPNHQSKTSFQSNSKDISQLTKETIQSNTRHHYGLLAYFKGWLEYANLESDKPVIHYIHTMFTHSPYYSQPDCSTRGNKYHVNSAEGNYNVVSCQTLLFKNIINQLKHLKIYDQTMIIIVSDHANHAPDNAPFGSNIIFAVKPFESRGKLRQSNARVINSDTPAVACIAIGGCPQYKGNNPFKNPKTQRRFITSTVGWPKDFASIKNYENIEFYEVIGDLFSKKNYQKISPK